MSRYAPNSFGAKYSRKQKVSKPGCHYHVLCGLKGLYMPDSNDVYPSYRKALSGAADGARHAKECGDKVTGSAREGFDVGEHHAIWIQECDMKDCLEEEK
jgi:hypothetical protein